jgi:perosamine synthetase
MAFSQINCNAPVKAFPSNDIRRLFARRLTDDPLLGSPDMQLYASGRAAIFHAVKSLGLSSEKVFLLPSFHCGVEVEAIIRAGYKVAFYRVNRDFSIDVDDLAGRIDASTGGVLIIHYFGFSQDMVDVKNLCAHNGAVLIEDCAHALYSKNPEGQLLGTTGDFGIFSLQKTISLPNGGGLLINSARAIKSTPGDKYYNHTMMKGLIRSLLEFEYRQGGIIGGCAGKLLLIYRNMTGSDSVDTVHADNESVDMRWYYDVPLFGYEHDISALSVPLIGKESYQNIIARRRDNYTVLDGLIKKAGMSESLMCQLQEGCCPLCLPISVHRRDKVVTAMQSMGVEPFVFGRSAHPLLERQAFPDAVYLADSVIGLPVQQQLNAKDMEVIIDVLRKSLR